ncbi:Knottin scorpion toxin-like superfamily [Arabidopsis thaliana x Arabidopsis arenosa]|uniref:Knottin scorpion toxin-like superfamily n=1 Tax=Arabidopsis thaliana x Arabidopsis arenosa TaxID=1240361 RepID=A0A8T2C5D7_9BRAS|nr:Knottin scorpion toxin-like superfamily [Arabidopsis thaliana x Arabidopsis arenosa]
MASSYTLMLFLCLSIFLIASTEMMAVEGRICERRSKTWTGFCGNTRGCDSQCKSWERASHGACHAQFPGFACFCYFSC